MSYFPTVLEINWLDQIFCQNAFKNAIVCGLPVANTCITLQADSVLFAGTVVHCLTELSCSVFIAMLLCSTDLNRRQRKVILTAKAQ